VKRIVNRQWSVLNELAAHTETREAHDDERLTTDN
jgi:hypothetical protein